MPAYSEALQALVQCRAGMMDNTMSYPVEQTVKLISREHRDGIPDETVEHIPFRQITLKGNISYTFGQVRRNLARFAPAKCNLATHSPMVAQWQARISRGNDPTSVYIANVASPSSPSTTLINNTPLRPGRRREVFSGATITLGRRPVCRGKVSATAVTYPPRFQLLVEPVIVTPAGPRPYYVFCSEVAAEKAKAVVGEGEGAAEAEADADDRDDEEEAGGGGDAERVWYPGLPLPAEDIDTADGDGCGGSS
ncbi:hypothetical protein UCDDS831_g00926 [Diplodia seriata]|uniref:FHA domain-containing protein n=1 Tax=Diplodia seriata TaxID=420778 RepID=A0A0G2EYE2_9PEZI|nr:hypothetical protein UCDDS831_g00926 [Diplodia seriata]